MPRFTGATYAPTVVAKLNDMPLAIDDEFRFRLPRKYTYCPVGSKVASVTWIVPSVTAIVRPSIDRRRTRLPETNANHLLSGDHGAAPTDPLPIRIGAPPAVATSQSACPSEYNSCVPSGDQRAFPYSVGTSNF